MLCYIAMLTEIFSCSYIEQRSRPGGDQMQYWGLSQAPGVAWRHCLVSDYLDALQRTSLRATQHVEKTNLFIPVQRYRSMRPRLRPSKFLGANVASRFGQTSEGDLLYGWGYGEPLVRFFTDTIMHSSTKQLCSGYH